mmetsp:Transcript_28088/g.49806  ORF Transcript_28088/g.49806 Transcript_28088/m.49806 type:complete len:266 (-) Transcript_28088:321-1118(-)
MTLKEMAKGIRFCLDQLNESELWTSLQAALQKATDTNGTPIRGLVCYGIGNFGTRRSSALLWQVSVWQLALALNIREYLIEQERKNGICANSSSTSKDLSLWPTMYYYEPLMTEQESKLLQKLEVQIIPENERGRRKVDSDNLTLFFMPHCPLALYTNLMATNWDCLDKVIIFGNSFDFYIEQNATVKQDQIQKLQSLEILNLLQPHWKEEQVDVSKKDISSRAAWFEQAFNDLGLTFFPSGVVSQLPERPLHFTDHHEEGDEVI